MRLIIRQCLVLLLLCISSAAWADIIEIDNGALQKLIEDGVPVVDVRRVDEWRKTGVIEGAHTLTFFDKQGRYDANKWLEALDKIAPKGKPVILICAAGVRSKSIAGLLDKRLGYTGVHNHTKGMLDWVGKGLPVVDYTSDAVPEKK